MKRVARCGWPREVAGGRAFPVRIFAAAGSRVPRKHDPLSSSFFPSTVHPTSDKNRGPRRLRIKRKEKRTRVWPCSLCSSFLARPIRGTRICTTTSHYKLWRRGEGEISALLLSRFMRTLFGNFILVTSFSSASRFSMIVIR